MPDLFVFTAGKSVCEGHTSGNVDAIGDEPTVVAQPKRPPPIPEERSPGFRAASIWTKK
jgi:hypothetical protein